MGKYSPYNSNVPDANVPRKIAAFDLDDTLISHTAGNKWNRNATSWKWWHSSVPACLKNLYSQGYLVAIISNQGNISLKDNPKSLQKDTLSLKNFKNQVTSMMRQLDFPLSVYAATAHDLYRKPRLGMWRELLEDYDIEEEGRVDLAGSFYVGDAAGRERTTTREKDHACSDRDLAVNIGITFHTPEEYFLRQSPEPFVRDFDPKQFLESQASNALQVSQASFQKRNAQELVIFSAPPAAGKSTFFWQVLQAQGYERVNQDILKSRERCIKVAKEHLTVGASVVVDNTNADVDTRAHWVHLAREFKVAVRCIYFTTSPRICEHNDAVRALNGQDTNPESRAMLPGVAFRSFVQRFVRPTLEEGFQDITEVPFHFQGTSEQREIWSQYWVQKFST